MKHPALTYTIALAILGALTSCAGTNKGRLTRPSPHGPLPEDPEFKNIQVVKSRASGVATPVAYIEYDDHGRMLQSQQRDDAVKLIQQTSAQSPWPLIVVHYVHGWKNGALSGDAASFQAFIAHLGSVSSRVAGRKFAVVGIFHAWPGAPYEPLKVIPKGDCVNRAELQPAPSAGRLAGLKEQFTVWDRWQVATRVASSSDANSLPDVMRQLNRRIHQQGGKARSLLIGHSMGGLISERAVVKDMVTHLDSPDYPDLVFLMNSAAPAIHAKRALESLQAQGRVRGYPRVFSITSEADKATKDMADFAMKARKIKMPEAEAPGPGEEEYMKGCPGHHPKLLSWFVGPTLRSLFLGCNATANDWLLEINIWPESEHDPRNKLSHWEVGCISAEQPSGRKSLQTEVREIQRRTVPAPAFASDLYPVVTVPKGLIDDHGDIWDTQAVSVLAVAIRQSRIFR